MYITFHNTYRFKAALQKTHAYITTKSNPLSEVTVSK